MRGDYSRDTFDLDNHYTRVLMQQGRVQMDSDWNEQVANLLHYLRSLARDLIGQHGAPAENPAFGIEIMPEVGHPDRIADLDISGGIYYVDGILCDAERPPTYYRQPNYPLDPAKQEDRLPDAPFLVYLEVWERHVTAIEDPHIRDVALGGADTAARTKMVFQVKVRRWADLQLPFQAADVTCDKASMVDLMMSTLRFDVLVPGPFARLEARAKVPDDNAENQPCIVSPEAKYRGAENQLYRVEIHRNGEAGGPNGATFKWSRENGSVVFPVRSVQGNTVTLDHLGRDERFGLEVGNWVELVDDATVLRGEVSPLLQVVEIDRFDLAVRLSGNAPASIGAQERHPLLRRWDHQEGDSAKGGLDIANDGAAAVVESATDWLNLEDGVQIRFDVPGGKYYSGTYWLIAARTETGDIEFVEPGEDAEWQIEHPRGHHYAPLAIVRPNPAPTGTTPRFLVTDLRHFFHPAANCCPSIGVSNPVTAAVGQQISFDARVAQRSAPVGAGLTYRWTITGATPASGTGPNISATATTAGTVVANLTVDGLPQGCPATARGICVVGSGNNN